MREAMVIRKVLDGKRPQRPTATATGSIDISDDMWSSVQTWWDSVPLKRMATLHRPSNLPPPPRLMIQNSTCGLNAGEHTDYYVPDTEVLHDLLSLDKYSNLENLQSEGGIAPDFTTHLT
jgi:hypothetical protein